MNWKEEYTKEFRYIYDKILPKEIIESSIEWNILFIEKFIKPKELISVEALAEILYDLYIYKFNAEHVKIPKWSDLETEYRRGAWLGDAEIILDKINGVES